MYNSYLKPDIKNHETDIWHVYYITTLFPDILPKLVPRKSDQKSTDLDEDLEETITADNNTETDKTDGPIEGQGDQTDGKSDNQTDVQTNSKSDNNQAIFRILGEGEKVYFYSLYYLETDYVLIVPNFWHQILISKNKCLFSDTWGQNIWKSKTYLKNVDLINQ